MAPETAALVGEVARLRAELVGHKRTLRRTREALHTTAAALARLEAECRRCGISLVLVHPGEEGDSSWPRPQPSPSSS